MGSRSQRLRVQGRRILRLGGEYGRIRFALSVSLLLIAAGVASALNYRGNSVCELPAALLDRAVSTTHAGAAQPPALRKMVGQMLLVGFRGTTVDAAHPIIRDIREYGLGGVILFDYDVVLRTQGRNIRDVAQVRELTACLQAAARQGEGPLQFPRDSAGRPVQVRAGGTQPEAPVVDGPQSVSSVQEKIFGNTDGRTHREQASLPLFIAVDQEGGRVARLKPEHGFSAMLSAATLGQGTVEAARAAGEHAGRMLADVGINLNFAPVLDVNVKADSPVIGALGRSFSADPAVVAAQGRAFAQGLNATGVIACFKHFPGHGSAGADSHLGVTDVTETWSDMELIPFSEVLRAPLHRAVMTGHLFNARLDADHPATLSHKVIAEILRDRLGYDGVVITDDMQMKAIADEYGLEEAVKRAVLAGADILLFGNNLQYDPDIVPTVSDILLTLVRSGEIPQERIEASYRRILQLKEGLR